MTKYVLKTSPQAFSAQGLTPILSPITILYAGKSGNSAFVASQTQKQFQQHGLNSAVYSMAEYDVENLPNEQYLFIIVSTRGEGDPPAQAHKFYNHLMGSQAPKLPELNFTVCALGDSSYEFFCQTGKEIDRRLEELGAKRYFDRIDCDVAFSKNASTWASAILNKYQKRINGDKVTLDFDNSPKGPTFKALVKEKYRLNGTESQAEVNHVVLKVDHPDFTYTPGDSVSIKPKNPYSLVVGIMKKMDYSPETIVKFESKTKSIEELLTVKLELTTLSEDVLQAYQEYTKDEQLQQLLEDKERMITYISQGDVLDLVNDFPHFIPAEQLTVILNKIQPRLYSIASSVKQTANEVHLTVKQYNYTAFGRARIGACSSYINKGLQIDSQVKIQFIPNDEFRLPEDNVPVIMIGAGTGIAPFLSFLQERAASVSPGDNWLLFGEKTKVNDFLYENKLNELKNQKILTRLDLAFSRDNEQKVYVQDKLKENAIELLQWLKRGAHIYVCGSIAMGKAVKETIIEILTANGAIEQRIATGFVNRLIQDLRYHEDVY